MRIYSHKPAQAPAPPGANSENTADNIEVARDNGGTSTRKTTKTTTTDEEPIKKKRGRQPKRKWEGDEDVIAVKPKSVRIRKPKPTPNPTPNITRSDRAQSIAAKRLSNPNPVLRKRDLIKVTSGKPRGRPRINPLPNAPATTEEAEVEVEPSETEETRAAFSWS